MISNIECHFCYEKISSSSFHAKCCMKKCNKHYCISCICKHFNNQFDTSQYKKQTWICYHCQEKCNCEPKPKKKSGKNSISKGNSEENGESNLIQKFELLQESYQPENNIIKDYQVHSKMLIPRDDIILMPFFMQRLAKRRNMFYQFMSREEKGSSDKIKNMLQEALREGNYSSNSDDDLEIIE